MGRSVGLEGVVVAKLKKSVKEVNHVLRCVFEKNTFQR
uniref:Uncharacterized protein n=1 Tax=Anopheles atroparvus TaxID=41427 RepID=A0AAG5CVW7_ANOAO